MQVDTPALWQSREKVRLWKLRRNLSPCLDTSGPSVKGFPMNMVFGGSRACSRVVYPCILDTHGDKSCRIRDGGLFRTNRACPAASS